MSWRVAVLYVQVVAFLGALGAGLGRQRWRLVRGEGGQSTVEYAVLAAVIVLTAMGAVQLFGQGITNVFQHILQRVQSIG